MTNATSTQEAITFIVKDMMISMLGLEESQLKETANLRDDLCIDSLDLTELQMELEKRFHVIITDEDAEKLKTVGDIIQFIKKKS